MWKLSLLALTTFIVCTNAQGAGLGGTQLPPQAGAQNPPANPIINWGKCPQLEPSETEKRDKAQIIKTCLERIPLPKEINNTAVEMHRAEVAKCALQLEGWFSEHGEYKYEKAEGEIRKKQLDASIQQKILTQHASCKQEAQGKYSKTEEVIAQIQLYQACMDYHISAVCGIKITYPSPASTN